MLGKNKVVFFPCHGLKKLSVGGQTDILVPLQSSAFTYLCICLHGLIKPIYQLKVP